MQTEYERIDIRQVLIKDEIKWQIISSDLALVEVLYGSGIRVSELCGLNLSDVDRSRNTLNVIGKGNKQRVVPLGCQRLLQLTIT